MLTLRNKLIDIKPGFFVVAALFLFLFPLRWVLGWMIAATVHELCHCVALWLCNVKIYCVHIDLNGAAIETEYMQRKQELIAAIAGPLGGVLLILFSRWLPCTAVCALVQSVYNLLPVYPLDGGRVLRCCMIGVAGEKNAAALWRLVEDTVLVLIFILAVIAGVRWHIGLLPAVCAVLLFVKSGRLKIPCKQNR